MLTILLVYHRNLQKFSNSLTVCPTFHLSSTFIVSRISKSISKKKCILSSLQKNRITVPKVIKTFYSHTHNIHTQYPKCTNTLYTKQNKYSITHILKSFKTPYCNMHIFLQARAAKVKKVVTQLFFVERAQHNQRFFLFINLLHFECCYIIPKRTHCTRV